MSLDLDAYLARIGYHGERTARHAVMAAIARQHAQSIPFENIDAFLGRRIRLDLDAVQRKLVQQRRGGWCFEQNLLLGEALRALGFTVTDLAARVLWNRPPDVVTGRTHRLLQVMVEGGAWIVDAGFGGQTLTGVLDLHGEAAQPTPHEPFRLRRHGDARIMEALIRGQWLPLCSFDLHPQQPVDFEAANFQLVHDPESFFTQTLIASRATPDGRWVLRGGELAFHALDGGTRRERLGDEDALLAALRGPLGIAIDGVPELRGRAHLLLQQDPAEPGSIADL